MLVEETSAATGTTAYEYDPAGNLIARTDANEVTVSYEYDEMNRLTAIDYPDDALDVTYEYDLAVSYGKGRLGRESRIGTNIEYRYDAFGRLVKETHGIRGYDRITRYSYNKNDGLSTVSHPATGKYSYYYDSEGRVIRVSARHGGGPSTNIAEAISYEPFGGIKSIQYGNDFVTNYNYDTHYDLRGISTSPTSPEDILRRSYEYDAKGNVASFYDSVDTDNSTGYGYNRQNRLTGRTKGDPVFPPFTIGIGYFANGNRSSYIMGTGGPEHMSRYVYTNNRLTSLTDIDDVVKAVFSYDNNGNMTSETREEETITYDYDQENRLVRVTENSANYDNGYNSRGQRQTLTTPSGTDNYLHALGGLLLAEYHSDTWDADYVYLDGQPLARVWAETDTIVPEEPGIEKGGMRGAPGPPQTPTIRTTFYIKWYHNDHLGTPHVMTDKNQNIRWQAYYYPFGKLAQETVSQPQNNLRFAGQYHDRATDLYYNMFRHYRPGLGRYL